MRGIQLVGFAAVVACSSSPSSPDANGGLTIGFASDASMIAEAGGTASVRVVLSRAADNDVTATVAVAGNARVANDFAAAPTTITIPRGQTERALDLTVVDDQTFEASETVELTLSAPVGAALGGATHTLTISDDDSCLASGPLAVCPTAAASDPVALTGAFDTTSDPRCAPAQPTGWSAAGQADACFVFGRGITVTDLAVTGSRALVLASTEDVTVMNLDAASHQAGTTGPAAPAAVCNFVTAPTASAAGGGGGAGGSFMTNSGNGSPGAGGGTGGQASGNVQPTQILRAGCNGQLGGAGDGAAGAQGRAGGAVFVVAADAVTLAGVVNVSGSGALESTNTSAGGSGGGSGGMLVVLGRALVASGAIVMANGGSGASGAGAAVAGNPGADPSPTDPTRAAVGGGAGGGAGAAGGRGFAGTTQAGTGGNNPAAGEGGGGGGGAGGYVRTNSALTGATVSAGRADVVP